MRVARESHGVIVLAVSGLWGCGSEPPGKIESSFETRQPFAEPAVLSSVDGVLDITLKSQPRDLMVSGRSVRGESYTDAFVGPTLQLEPGDEIRLLLENGLEQHTNVHFHGLHVSPSGDSDNVLRHILPGETGSYLVRVPATHDQGVFWYHSHLHMDSESQVFQGLSGTILIGDSRRLLPERFREVRHRLLSLKDLQVEDGAIVAANIDSDAPTTRTVNGLVNPVITLSPQTTEVWSIANIGADIFYDVQVQGVPFLVIGEDGNPVERSFEASHLVMPPGKRWEVIVQFPDATETAFITRAYDQGGDHYPEAPLAQLSVAGEPLTPIEPLGPDQPIGTPENLLERTVVETREWVFTENDSENVFHINGKAFDENRVDVSPKLGTVEEWTLRNSTDEQHPFHIHVNDFRVMSVNGEPYEARGEQDTVVLPPREEVVVRIPFDDFTGKFVFHCHILNHEDNGMMALVDVVP